MRIFLLLVVLFLPASAIAQADLENYYNYNTSTVAAEKAAPKPEEKMDGAKRQVVTSVQKCFEEIGPEAAAKIRARSLTPYADCQKALREKAARDKEEAESAGKEEAETPRNFKRVSEEPEDAEAKDNVSAKPDTGEKTKKAVK